MEMNRLTHPVERHSEFLYVNVKLMEIQAVLTLHYTVLTETSANWSPVLTLQGSVGTETKT